MFVRQVLKAHVCCVLDDSLCDPLFLSWLREVRVEITVSVLGQGLTSLSPCAHVFRVSTVFCPAVGLGSGLSNTWYRSWICACVSQP